MDVPVVVVALIAALALLAGVLLGLLLARRSRSDSDLTARTAADLERRQVAMAGLVAPLAAGLERLDGQLNRLEHDRARSEAGLAAELRTVSSTSEALRVETATLVNAMRAPHVRGRWGEMQLERTVEAAGMQRHVDFDTQVVSAGDGDRTDGPGGARPDMIVRLLDGKQLVVDAKVPFAAYLEALEARDEPRRDDRLRAHARQLRTHVDALAAKRYHDRFEPTPEFVVCFVPADAFLDAALRADPSLQEHAFGRGVVLATPSTLVALLRTVAYTWRQDSLARDARQIQQLGHELYQRLSSLSGHVDRLGRSLTQAVDSYNRAVGAMESRVLVSARRLRDLGVVDGSDSATELAAPTQIDRATRSSGAA